MFDNEEVEEAAVVKFGRSFGWSWMENWHFIGGAVVGPDQFIDSIPFNGREPFFYFNQHLPNQQKSGKIKSYFYIFYHKPQQIFSLLHDSYRFRKILKIWSRNDEGASVLLSFIYLSSAQRLNRILFDPSEVVQHQNTVSLPKSDNQTIHSAKIHNL